MIGNDIIDLEIPISGNWKSSRYLNKLYSSAEQTAIFNSDTPETLLQLFWSWKEAAYKAHQRHLKLPRKYNPLAFQCEIISEERNNITGIVKINSETYFTISTITAAKIHTVATFEKKSPLIQKFFQDNILLKDKLIAEYSTLLKEAESDLKIEKDINNIPHLFIKNQSSRNAFSISHHGRYSAFAISLINC